MKQIFSILFDLDGTLVDTAPDLIKAHNHVMKKYGYSTKSTNEIRNLVGRGAGVMIGRSIWGQAKKEFDTEQSKIQVPAQPLASATVGQRLSGTSAKGVKMKRSKLATSTGPKGTKQLSREQQTKSLNILCQLKQDMTV